MKTTTLDLCYKGTRDYVHGTDIFNACMKSLSTETELPEIIDMSIHAIMRNQLCILSQTQPSSSEKFSVIFKFSRNGIENTLYLKEIEDEIKCRYEYNEEGIVEKAMINSVVKSITLEPMKQFSVIEKVVALNKKLLSSIFKDISGKWFFARIKLKEVPLFVRGADSAITVALKRNLDFKITDSTIIMDDKIVGNIYFTLV